MQKDKSTSCKADKKENGVQKEKAKSEKGKKADDINDGKRKQVGHAAFLEQRVQSGVWISVSKVKGESSRINMIEGF